MAKGCAPKLIRFKAHGKVVSFRGRPGGTTRHGGDCAPKAATAAQRAQRHRVAAAGRACRAQGRPGTARNTTCLKGKLR